MVTGCRCKKITPLKTFCAVPDLCIINVRASAEKKPMPRGRGRPAALAAAVTGTHLSVTYHQRTENRATPRGWARMDGTDTWEVFKLLERSSNEQLGGPSESNCRPCSLSLLLLFRTPPASNSVLAFDPPASGKRRWCRAVYRDGHHMRLCNGSCDPCCLTAAFEYFQHGGA